MPAISVSTPEAVQIKRPLFACSVSVSEGAARVTVTGEMDIATVPQLDAALRLAEAGSASVVLDLRGLEFMDSSAAHLLLAADRRLSQAGGRLVVVRGTAEIGWYLALVGLDRQLELVDPPPEQPACANLGGRSGVSSTSHAPQIAVIAMTGELDAVSLQRRVTQSLDAGLRPSQPPECALEA